MARPDTFDLPLPFPQAGEHSRDNGVINITGAGKLINVIFRVIETAPITVAPQIFDPFVVEKFLSSIFPGLVEEVLGKRAFELLKQSPIAFIIYMLSEFEDPAEALIGVLLSFLPKKFKSVKQRNDFARAIHPVLVYVSAFLIASRMKNSNNKRTIRTIRSRKKP